MPEVIWLISSSPPPVAWCSKNPSAAIATFDLTGDTSTTALETKKTYGDSNISPTAPLQNAAHTMKNTSPREQMVADKDAYGIAKINKDFVFVDDDDYSSEVDLSKEYSLKLSQIRKRIKNKNAAEAAAKANAPAPSSPVESLKSTNYVAPAKSPLSSRTRVITSNSKNPAEDSRYRMPIIAAAPNTLLNKPSEMAKYEYVLDADFSSNNDLDKMYDLESPATKRRKVTPEADARHMEEKEKQRHGLPGLSSSAVSTRSYNVEVEKCGLPDLLIPPSKRAEAKLAPAITGSHGLPDLFTSPSRMRSAVSENRSTEAARYSLPDLLSPSPRRVGLTQARLDSGTTKTFMRKSFAPRATAEEASLPKPLKRTQNRVLDSDPITFTSSPDFAEMAKDGWKRREQALSKDKQLSEIANRAAKSSTKASIAFKTLDSDSDELPELPSLRGASRALTRTTSDTSHLTKFRSVPASRTKSLARSKSMADPAVKPKKRAAKTDDEKAAEAAEKAATKETEAERKRLLKEEKERNKAIAQDLAKANMLKTDKKKSTPEMIVLFPQEMDKKLQETAEGFLCKLSVEFRNWAGAGATPGEVAGSGMVKNVIRWKRKVDAVHNDGEDIWEPVPRRIENEKHVLVHLLAKEFVGLVTADEGRDLDEHAMKLKSRFYDHKVIYLIEGLTSWQKKNVNLRNRQFTAAVRAQALAVDETTSFQTTTSSRGRKKKPPPEYISDDLIEDALLSLQIKHKVFIHHTASLVESAEWISIFTQHISTIPYRLQKMNLDTSFCMESGQVRAGEDARDTFVKMLCEMRGVTAPVGWGVEAEIGGSVKQLVEKFRREGKEAFALAKKGANRDGAFTDRNVGKAISKRIHNVFMGKDPGSTDV